MVIRTELCQTKDTYIEILQVVMSSEIDRVAPIIVCGIFKIKPKDGYSINDLWLKIVHAYDNR
jgi:hypothetical protein